jgi:hypothetical protein
MDDADVAAPGEEGLGPLCQGGVKLDRRDPADRTDQLGQDRAIAASAGADMDDMLAGLRAEGLEEFGVQRRTTVVDPARRVERDDQVLVEHDRVSAGQPMGAVARRHGPRRRPQEGLARHGSVGGFDRRIVDAEDRQHLPGIGPSHDGELVAGEGTAVLVRKRGGGWHGAVALSRQSRARWA